MDVSFKEAQNKLIHFLEEEFSKLKLEYEQMLKKRIMKRKNIDKKREKLYQKAEAILRIQSLDLDIKQALLFLQQEIRDFS